MRIKISKKSFKELLEEAYPEIFTNYATIIESQDRMEIIIKDPSKVDKDKIKQNIEKISKRFKIEIIEG